MKTNLQATAWLSGICFTLFLVMALSAWVAQQQRSQAFESDVQQLHRVNQQHIALMQLQLQQEAMIAAKSVLANSSIKKATVEAAESYQRQPEDRNTLSNIRHSVFAELERHWQALQPFSVKQLHLHLGPDAFTLLRAHRPELHSDRLNTVRPLVMSVLKGDESLAALEVGRHGFGVRAVVPVRNKEQRTVGAIEVGLGINQLIFERQQLLLDKGIRDSGVSLLMSSTYASVLHPTERFGYGTDSQWLQGIGVEPHITRWLQQGFIPSDITQPQQLQFEHDGQHFLVSMVPWYAFQQAEGQSAPVVVLAWNDVTGMVLAHKQQNLRIWLLWIFSACISLVLIVFFSIRLQKAAADSIKEQQKKLYWSEQRLDALFRLSPLPILLNRKANGAFIEANPAMEKLTGYSERELRDLSYWDITPDSFVSSAKEHMESLQNNGRYGPCRKQYRHKKGHLIDIEVNGLCFVNPAGESMVWTIVQDLTDRNRIEQMKNEFISTVSHELRTPLTSVTGALGLALSGRLGELPEKAEKILSTGYRNSQRLALLINDLLDIEKIAAGKLHFDMQVQPIGPILEQAREENQAYGIDRRVKILLSGELPDADVWVDEQRTKQVLANLLSNAIKFSPAGGSVIIDAQADDDHVTVSVIDQGSGIAEEFKHRIFQRFAQADGSDARQKGGTGLGLAISQQLIEHMQGRIGFESVKGSGTRFFFQLPLVKTVRAPHAQQVLGSSDKTDGSVRILVVEDAPDVAYLLKGILEDAGYRVDICFDGEQALDALKKHHYDLISLDLMLPDISGLEIIRRVREHAETAEIPIVVVSAKMEKGRLELNGVAGGIEWLVKPVDPENLVTLVKRQLQDHMHPKILHVEDDADLHAVINAMVAEHMTIDNAPNLKQAQSMLIQHTYDAILLDISLPDGSGWELIPEIKKMQPKAVIIVLTGEDVSSARISSVEGLIMKSRLTTDRLIAVVKSRIRQAKTKAATGRQEQNRAE